MLIKKYHYSHAKNNIINEKSIRAHLLDLHEDRSDGAGPMVGGQTDRILSLEYYIVSTCSEENAAIETKYGPRMCIEIKATEIDWKDDTPFKVFGAVMGTSINYSDFSKEEQEFLKTLKTELETKPYDRLFKKDNEFQVENEYRLVIWQPFSTMAFANLNNWSHIFLANGTNQSLRKYIAQACEIFEDLSEGSGFYSAWISDQDIKVAKEKTFVINDPKKPLNKQKFEQLYELEYKLKEQIRELAKNKSSKSLIKAVEINFVQLKTQLINTFQLTNCDPQTLNIIFPHKLNEKGRIYVPLHLNKAC